MGSCQTKHPVATIEIGNVSTKTPPRPSTNECSFADDKTVPLTPPPFRRGSVGMSFLWAQRLKTGHLAENVVHLERGNNKVSIETVYRGVHDGTILGEGVAGVVRKVQHIATGFTYAVKVLTLKRLLTPQRQEPPGQENHASDVGAIASQMESLRNEITIMSQLDHPHIARLQEVYQDESHIYLVQEICSGGDLFDWLYMQPDERLDEPTTCRIIWQILSAVRYLHDKGIVHRDLKLENFLFCTNRREQVKMIGAYSRVF
jgi:Protein kinase domain